jgi:predicted thioesterase
MPAVPGSRADLTVAVTEADTAIALGSGDVPVLATPRVLALVERATVAAVAGDLHASETTVGVQVRLEHLAPTPVGATVEVSAELVSQAGRRLVFDVRVTGGGGVVASGTVTRVLVERAAFLAALAPSG